jgi:predicted RNA-binding Zn ribbon-like protein
MSVVTTTHDQRRAGFPFRSGRLCLDFVATVAKRGMGDVEMLGGPTQLRTWLYVAELPAVPQEISDLAPVHELREAIHDLTRAHVDGKPIPPAAIGVINSYAAPGVPATLLGSDAHTPLPPAQASLEEGLSLLARDTIELFTGPLQHRIRACVGHDCSLFFVDRSRPGTRRWCAMATCGEKASSAAYRQRHAQRSRAVTRGG